MIKQLLKKSYVMEMIEEGMIIPAPSMGGKIMKKGGELYFLSNNREIKIPPEVVEKISIKKQNGHTIAYTE